MAMNIDTTRGLIKLEQDMDGGKIKYVMLHGERMSVSNETFDILGLKIGQTISTAIAIEIIKAELDGCMAQIATKKALADGQEVE